MVPDGARPRVEGDREGEILDATLELLLDAGYDRLTMDAVATRAKASKATLYRRWSTKASLVVDALSRSKHAPELQDPDTGSLRGTSSPRPADRAGSRKGHPGARGRDRPAHRRRVRRGVPERILAPKVELSTRIYARAQARGEIRRRPRRPDPRPGRDPAAPGLPAVSPSTTRRSRPSSTRSSSPLPPGGPTPPPPKDPHDRPLRHHRRRDPAAAPPTSGHHLGWALVLISVAQLMVVLDSTIANIALPYIKTDLSFSVANLSWVVTGYALVFGGSCCSAARLGDLYGRRRIFGRPGDLRGRLADRRVRPERGDAGLRGLQGSVPRSPPPPPGADHHDLPGRAAAQPRLRRLRRDVRGRRGRPG